VRVTTRGSGSGASSRWRPAGIFVADADPLTLRRLTDFFIKIRIFKHILAQISDEKRGF